MTMILIDDVEQIKCLLKFCKKDETKVALEELYRDWTITVWTSVIIDRETRKKIKSR